MAWCEARSYRAIFFTTTKAGFLITVLTTSDPICSPLPWATHVINLTAKLFWSSAVNNLLHSNRFAISTSLFTFNLRNKSSFDVRDPTDLNKSSNIESSTFSISDGRFKIMVVAGSPRLVRWNVKPLVSTKFLSSSVILILSCFDWFNKAPSTTNTNGKVSKLDNAPFHWLQLIY